MLTWSCTPWAKGVGQHRYGCTLQINGTWEGYLIAAAADKQTLGSSTAAQDLLRKRYVGISGSNKVLGALEIQQVDLCNNATDDDDDEAGQIAVANSCWLSSHKAVLTCRWRCM